MELSLQLVDLHSGMPADLFVVGAMLTRLLLMDTNLMGHISPQLGDLPWSAVVAVALLLFPLLFLSRLPRAAPP